MALSSDKKEPAAAANLNISLAELGELLARMGGMVERQLGDATDALARRDSHLASRAVSADKAIDAMERQVEDHTIKIVAESGNTSSGDFREILSAIKIAADLERIGDLSKNMGKRTLVLNEEPPFESVQGLRRMLREVKIQLTDVLDALSMRDADKAHAVWLRDEEIDSLNNSLFREVLTYMMEDPRNISICTHLLFMAKNAERIGDHCTNIAEIVYAQATGETLDQDRPKGDRTSVTLMTPGARFQD